MKIKVRYGFGNGIEKIKTIEEIEGQGQLITGVHYRDRFTGMQDKHGDDIFENDVLRLTGMWNGIEYVNHTVEGRVFYSEADAAFMIAFKEGLMYLYGASTHKNHNIEVVSRRDS